MDSAVEQKNLGNEAYKKRDFETAHKHYDAAIALSPKNCTFYTNKAADYKLIAKAMARIATAYIKLENLKDAMYWYEKSLAEHRDPDIVKKHKQLQKDMQEKERLSYID
uniref:Uncharacterized protein n=1 Tax=Panagrolaimus sp. ES5 TaxID=591445 RepID=A0AC34FKS1_9BILA